MTYAEVFSWLFVSQEWNRLRRMPIPDKGFEESFREYIYSRMHFDSESTVRDMGLGLSYSTLSDTPHELDVVCTKGKELLVFELKHYEVSYLTKEIVFTFLGKVIDYYLKNCPVLSDFEVSMLLVTINQNVDDSIRKLCITYGIKLIEPSQMTIKVIDYYLRDLYQKTLDREVELKQKTAELINRVGETMEHYDYSFSDIFRFRGTNVEIDLPLLEIVPADVLNKIREYYSMFEAVKQEWRSKTS